MPHHCSVPLCSSHKGGHKFPSDEKMNMKWKIAIKRLEPGTNKPWIPKKYNVVCEKHFTADDYIPAGLFAVNNLDELDYDLLLAEDQLFLTIIKLRQDKDDIEVSILFRISQTYASKIVNVWINFMFFQLQEINFWPERNTVQDLMPVNFKKQFPSTRVILDATEVPIQKPSNVNSQSAKFSTYKNRNTLKTMIGCTPGELISYVSDSYDGSASDRQIIERSCLIQGHMFESGDSIMADRGIRVQDLFALLDVKVNTPTMLQRKSQLEPQEVITNRRIASKRIHVERVIGIGKTFKILQRPVPATKIPIDLE
ncbi:uncharacterized protein LOC143040483 [Oratosquilla oratoria]|uniref:uncharacterized protein LOC143040483 n=1 Tax=Oratosquilla oratoria TaxID=337810 RepID=UPI003F758AAE